MSSELSNPCEYCEREFKQQKNLEKHYMSCKMLKKIKDLEQQYSNPQQQLEQAQTEHQQQLEQAQTEHQQQLDHQLEQVQTEHQQQLEQVQTEHQHQLEQVQAQHQQQLEQLNQQLQKWKISYKQLYSTIQTYEQFIEQISKII